MHLRTHTATLNKFSRYWNTLYIVCVCDMVITHIFWLRVSYTQCNIIYFRTSLYVYCWFVLLFHYFASGLPIQGSKGDNSIVLSPTFINQSEHIRSVNSWHAAFILISSTIFRPCNDYTQNIHNTTEKIRGIHTQSKRKIPTYRVDEWTIGDWLRLNQ